MSHLIQPTIVLLKDGSESAQGKSHIVHNINACMAVGEIVKTTLGPRGMDKLIYTPGGKTTITNDGRTVIDLIDVVHPAAKTLVDIAVAQDNMVGDGTTTVVVLASELLRQAKLFVEDGVHPRTIIRAYRRACSAAVERLGTLAVEHQIGGGSGGAAEEKKEETAEDGAVAPASVTTDYRSVLERCAQTALQSKLIANHREFFGKMAVDAVLSLDPAVMNLDLVGVAKVSGGSVTQSRLVEGVAFQKTFSYAGFEQQPKAFENPKILLLNVELELKAEKENAEVRISDPAEYQSIVDAEWKIIFDKLARIVDSQAKVILSKLPIGDLATQYFADRSIFCAGRVPVSDLRRVAAATGAIVQTSLGDLSEEILGTCGQFQESQVGNERYNFLTGCPNAKACTMILRGGAEQFIEETHRSMYDALMIVKRCVQHRKVVAGGGAIEMELSRYLRDISRQIKDKSQMLMAAFAKALEVIPRQLAHNAGIDSTDVVNQLRYHHHKGERWYGVDIENGGVCDTMKLFVWEPAVNKHSALSAATEAACTILSIDETIKNAKAEEAAAQAAGKKYPGGPAAFNPRPSIM